MLFSQFVFEIEKNALLQKGDTVVAAVSGGADSVCLLHLLCRLRPLLDIKLICAHVNHGIREEAEHDADFVADICRAWDVPFVLHTADVGEIARKEKISKELAGRDVRYSFFKSIPADVIMTAHTKNDVAESVLLHMIRGCGLEGLCGISPKREDGICRPLLSFKREQIENYLRAHALSWCEDKTNASLLYTRNKIRHTILPRAEEINPSFVNAIFRMTEILQEENAYINEKVKACSVFSRDGDALLLSVDALSAMPLALRRRAVRAAVENFEEAESVLALLKKENGSTCSLSGGKIAEREYANISIYTPSTGEIQPVELPFEGEIVFGEYKITVGEGGMCLPKKKYIVRARQNGDVFAPEGMEGHKKVKDFLIEKKIPRRLRNGIPIFTHMDTIAAVGTLRRSRAFSNHDGEMLQIKIERIMNV